MSHSSHMSVTIPEILSHYSALGYSAGDVLSTGTVSGVAGFSPGRRVALPEARRRDGVRDRADRRAAQPGRLVAGGHGVAGAAAGALVSGVNRWPRDEAKLERVRGLMAEHDLDALVVRAPDNAALPHELPVHEGLRRRASCRARATPTLIVLEPAAGGRRGAWPGRATSAASRGYDETRPAPAHVPLDRGRDRSAARARPDGARRPGALDRHADGRPDGGRADAFPRSPGSTPSTTWPARSSTRRRCSRARARSRRRRRSSACASRTTSPRAACEHVRDSVARGHERGARSAALWEGFVHGEGTGWEGRVGTRARLHARLVRAGHPHVHRDLATARSSRTSRRCSRSGSAPTATGAT